MSSGMDWGLGWNLGWGGLGLGTFRRFVMGLSEHADGIISDKPLADASSRTFVLVRTLYDWEVS